MKHHTWSGARYKKLTVLCHPRSTYAAHHGDEDSTTGVSEEGGGDGGCSTVAKITGVSSPSTCNLTTFSELLMLGELRVLTCGRLMVLPSGSGSPGCSSLIEGSIKARHWSNSVCAIIRMEDQFWTSFLPLPSLFRIPDYHTWVSNVSVRILRRRHGRLEGRGRRHQGGPNDGDGTAAPPLDPGNAR